MLVLACTCVDLIVQPVPHPTSVCDDLRQLLVGHAVHTPHAGLAAGLLFEPIKILKLNRFEPIRI